MKHMGHKIWMSVIALGMSISMLPVNPVYAAKTVSGSSAEYTAVKKEETSGRWEYREDKWYYYDTNGNLGKEGWIQYKNQHDYLTADGYCLINQITPDGYFVDSNGVWYQRSAMILGRKFVAPDKFLAVTSAWSDKETLKHLKTTVSDIFENRRIRITNDSLEYLSEDNEEKVLIGIYKNKQTDSYRMDIGIRLDNYSTDKSQSATYDYQVFQAFLYSISSTPELLIDAIYNSWEEDNRWNINRTGYTQVGDAMVKYTGGSGCGYYYIRSATAE